MTAMHSAAVLHITGPYRIGVEAVGVAARVAVLVGDAEVVVLDAVDRQPPPVCR